HSGRAQGGRPRGGEIEGAAKALVLGPRREQERPLLAQLGDLRAELFVFAAETRQVFEKAARLLSRPEEGDLGARHPADVHSSAEGEEQDRSHETGDENEDLSALAASG